MEEEEEVGDHFCPEVKQENCSEDVSSTQIPSPQLGDSFDSENKLLQEEQGNYVEGLNPETIPTHRYVSPVQVATTEGKRVSDTDGEEEINSPGDFIEHFLCIEMNESRSEQQPDGEPVKQCSESERDNGVGNHPDEGTENKSSDDMEEDKETLAESIQRDEEVNKSEAKETEIGVSKIHLHHLMEPNAFKRSRMNKKVPIVKDGADVTPEKDASITKGAVLDENGVIQKKSPECGICKKKFSSNSTLNRHWLLHTGIKSHTCATCGKSFARLYNLTIHERIHSGERPFICETCGKGFSTSNGLRYHKDVHSGVKPYVCNICGKAFSCSSPYVRHKRIHEDEKLFSCDVCGKGFNRMQQLSEHQHKHSGEKPFVCQLCGKAFAYSYSLTEHKKTHSDVKPHTCTVCGKGFTRAFYLSCHARIHTGEKPNVCTVCGKRFTHASNLNQHKRVHVKEKVCDEITASNVDEMNNRGAHVQVVVRNI